ncbi:MAG: enoyl-CoA hydratase-related protein [Porticoccaceae bacterium]
MEPFCKTETDGSLLIVTMNRPDSLNALIPTSHEEMSAIWDDFYANDDLRVAILTGAGRGFCAGSDISAYTTGTSKPMPATGGAGLTSRSHRPKPIIAAVNGHCLGGGLEITMACDLVIAAENACFGVPEPLVGAVALGGGIARMCRKIPYTVAMGLALTGDKISAQEAYRIGLINELAAEGEAVTVARKWAEKILRCAPLAVAKTKEICDRALEGETLEESIAFEEASRPHIMGSADFAEGMKAFMEKRKPNWQGK